jgi:hypothetical protein
MTAAQNHSATSPTVQPADAEERQSARINAAIATAAGNGHRMSKPYDNGGDFLMAHCRDCGQLCLASANIATGSALSTQCTSVKPVHTAPTTTATATPAAPVGTWAHRSTTFEPSTQATCQHCGNGYTIVGRSCAKCAKSKELVSAPGRSRNTYMQTDNNLIPVAADMRRHEGTTWKLLTNKIRDGQVAPCGKVHGVSVIYVPADWDPDDIAAGIKPDRLTAFPCHEACVTVYHQPRPIARIAPPLQADYADAAKHKPRQRAVVAAARAVRLATLKVRRAPNTRRATIAAVNNAYSALETYRATIAAARGPRRSAIFIARYNHDVATNGNEFDHA